MTEGIRTEKLMTRREKLSAQAAYVATIVLSGGSIFSSIVFFYIIYYQRITGRHFTSLVEILLYYVFPAALAALCLACLRLQPSYRINVALFLLSTVASIYVVETITTIWFSLPSVIAELGEKERIEAAKELGIRFDARSKLAVIADLRRKGIDAYPSISPSALLKTKENGNPKIVTGAEFVPLAGISNKVSVLCNEGGEYTVYENDEHGFHNPKGLWNTGRVDIVALGDSYVQGFCVPSDKNFVALMRNRYPATLNLGMAGQGPLMMLATIKEYVRWVKPRVVLWFHYEGSSLVFLKNESNSPFWMRYLNTGFSQGLFERQAEIDRALATYAEAEMKKSGSPRKLEELFAKVGNPSQLLHQVQGIVKLSQMRQTLGLIYTNDNHESDQVIPGDLTPSVKDLFAQVLLEARTSVNAWAGQVYFVYLPAWRTNWSVTVEDKKDILNLANSLGFSIIDIHRVFQAQSDPLALFLLRMPGHYNAEGHRLVAETVLKSIPSIFRNAASSNREEIATSYQKSDIP
jgi:hypothetical protein